MLVQRVKQHKDLPSKYLPFQSIEELQNIAAVESSPPSNKNISSSNEEIGFNLHNKVPTAFNKKVIKSMISRQIRKESSIETLHADNADGPAELSKDLPSAKILNDRPRDARSLEAVKHGSVHFQSQTFEAVEREVNENVDNKSTDLS
eukprot:2016845-Ditylum_brightwellii.AAC.1